MTYRDGVPPDKARAWAAAHRKRQQARGRCISCPEPVALSKLGKPMRRCAVHAALHRERAARAKEARP